YFFFQAEDGIRDFHVTGVQTCALPIWRDIRSAQPLRHTMTSMMRRSFIVGLLTVALLVSLTPAAAHAAAAPTAKQLKRALITKRSEERRVGKECRSRWTPEQDRNRRAR